MSAENKPGNVEIRLCAIIAPDPDERWAFTTARERIRLGRALDNDVVLGDPSVSRSHAQIAIADGQCLIEDSGSSLGVYVNGAKIAAPTPLANGDCIGIGGILLRFEIDTPVPDSAHPFDALLSISDPDAQHQTKRQAPLASRAHTIGRDGRCDVVLDDAGLAPVEAILTIKQDQWRIAPVLGAIATSIDGDPLSAPVLLTGGQRVCVGRYELRLRKPAPLQAAHDETSATSGESNGAAAAAVPVIALHDDGEGKTDADPEFALMCLTTELRGMRYPLRRLNVTLGSDPNCELQISSLPSRALTLSRGRSHYRLKVLDPALPLRISGNRQAPCELRKGDLIDLGGLVFRLIRRSEPFTSTYDPAEIEPPTDALRSRVSGKHIAAAIAVLVVVGALIWVLL